MTLLCTLTINGGTAYLASSQFAGSVFRKATILGEPEISWTANGGMIRPALGRLEIANDPTRLDAVFGHGRGWPPTPAQLCQVALEWGEGVPIFAGSGYLAQPLGQQRVTVELWEPEYTTMALTTVTDKDGQSVPNSLIFGSVTYRPVVRTGATTLATPAGLDLTQRLEVQENGIVIGTNQAGQGNTFAVAPTASTITLGSNPSGEVTISATGTASHLLGVFQWVAGKLGLTLDATRAPSAALWPVAWVVDQDMLVIDLAAKVAETFGHQFWIEGSTLYLLDRLYRCPSQRLPQAQIDYEEAPAPVKVLKAEWTIKQPLAGAAPRLTDVKKSQSLVGLAVGRREVTLEALWESEAAVPTLLANRLEIERAQSAKITVPGINTSVQMGDCLRYDDLTAQVTVELRVQGKHYHLAEPPKTSWTGPIEVAPLVRE